MDGIRNPCVFLLSRYWVVDDYSFESLSFGRRMRLVGFDC